MIRTVVNLIRRALGTGHLSAQIQQHLEITHELFDTYMKRSARPYYPLNDGWGLTTLSTGQPFFVNTEDRNITPWIIMGGHWESNVDRVLMAYVRPGMTVLDIGANMGYYTVKLGTRIGPSGLLRAFEPNPEVNAFCLENIKINGLSGHVHLEKYALGDINSIATLTRSASNMASANLCGDQEADYSVRVDVKKLDDVMKDGAADLIKLDAEGYEPMILQGARKVLARSPNCAIMIELGLERWERSQPLETLPDLCGGHDRAFYAVLENGQIERLPLEKLRDFLLTCPYHENYFLVGKPTVIEALVSELIRPAQLL